MGWKFDDFNRTTPSPDVPTNTKIGKLGRKNILAKNAIEEMGWEYDPNSELSKEEQKKLWLEQSRNNVLVVKTIDAMEVEKKPEETEDMKKKSKVW